MDRQCPSCEGRKILMSRKADIAGLKYVHCGCEACKAIWSEYTSLASGRVDIDVILPGLPHLVPMHLRKAAVVVQGTTVPKESAPPIMHEDGCPECGSAHIALKTHGPGNASCSCVECGATWTHRYETAEERVYRTNIVPGEYAKSIPIPSQECTESTPKVHRKNA